eukprot:scaffold24332_cov19-Tisochrysis_lutea.AAC.1
MSNAAHTVDIMNSGASGARLYVLVAPVAGLPFPMLHTLLICKCRFCALDHLRGGIVSKGPPPSTQPVKQEHSEESRLYEVPELSVENVTTACVQEPHTNSDDPFCRADVPVKGYPGPNRCCCRDLLEPQAE